MKTIIYIGCILLVVGVILVSSAVKRSIRGRTEAGESLLRLLLHLRVRMSCYLESAEDSLRDYSDPYLSEAGFLPVGADGIFAAYCRLRASVRLSAQLDSVLSEYFKSFGESYLDTEMRKINTCIERVEGIVKTEKEEGLRRGRVISVVVAAAATCFALLML